MEPGESLIVTPGAILGLFYLQRYRFLTITQVARVTGLSYHHTADLLRGFAARGHVGHFGHVRIPGHGKTPKAYYLKRKGWELLRRASDIPGYHRQRLHRTFSHKFNDFAIELYIFVADNYALFYNLAKEATDRDTSKVLDAHLYNVSDLDPDEWYFDTGAYSEINFTAFAMLGKSFCPRIKNIQDQGIYKIRNADYGSLNPLLKGAKHTIQMEPIVDQW